MSWDIQDHLTNFRFQYSSRVPGGFLEGRPASWVVLGKKVLGFPKGPVIAWDSWRSFGFASHRGCPWGGLGVCLGCAWGVPGRAWGVLWVCFGCAWGVLGVYYTLYANVRILLPIWISIL